MSQDSAKPAETPSDIKKEPASSGSKAGIICLIVVVALIILAGVYRVGMSAAAYYASYCRIITPTGKVVVYRGRGEDFEWDLAEIKLEDLNRRISELSPNDVDNIFPEKFRQEAAQRLAEMGYRLARPGEKPDPDKAQQIMVALVEGEFYYKEKTKRDKNENKKGEFGSLQELQSSNDFDYVPSELTTDTIYQGYQFTTEVSDNADEREKAFILYAKPMDGKGPQFYADQTGVIRRSEQGSAGISSPQVEKVDLLDASNAGDAKTGSS